MLKSILASLALASGLLAAQPALAVIVCSGEAKGPANSKVVVTLEVRPDGKVLGRRVIWTPPSSDTSPFPMVIVGYDDNAASLDRPANLLIAAMAPLKPMPASASAGIEVAIEGRTWRVPWRMYPGMMADARKDKAGEERKPVFIWGMVPVAFDMAGKPKTNPELLPVLASARRMDVTVAGDAPGEVFGRATYDLSDLKARDGLHAEASAKADEAARAPKVCPRR